MPSESTEMQQQQQQLAAVLGPDPSQFETLISHLMSSSNEQRSHAESIFNLIKQTDPNSLALKLAQLLSSSPLEDARSLSAILLRKQLTRDDSYIWPRLSPATQSTIKSVLLTVIQNENSKSIIKKLCDTISELASSILPDNEWPEILPFMFQCVTSNNPKLQESAFLIFSQLAQYIGDTLVPYIKDLHAVFLQVLNHSTSPDVRISSLSAVINFIQCLDNSTDRDRFQDLLPAMMKTLTEALNSSQEATAQEALELLIELAGTEPRFLRRQLVDVVGSMLQIAEAQSLEEGTRHLAIEFVITLAEARERAPGMMRKLPQFISRLFAILMNMLLDIEDVPEWHSAVAETEDAGESNNYSVAQESLDRLAIALGGNTIVPVASDQLPAYLAAPEWQKHHAALIALAQIAEGCSKVMITNLEQVVNMVLNSFQDPHPRVRWAAINAIGQLSTDLGPDLQVQYHHRVLPALASAMDDFQNPRVQAHAASAVLNFSENCTPEILTPYLDGIVSKLLVLLQNGKQMVQEGALTALASVADSSQEHFKKYYDAVMPYLKTILVNATDKSTRMLRAKAMECISLVGMAVGKDKFRDDAKQVMEVLMSLQGTEMENDDPTTSYMLQAWARLCKCLGQDFLPYMSVVMPPLLQSAQLKPDVTITSADSDDELDESDDDSMETITLGDKRIGIKTSVLEEKATACNMLCCYADELKEGFYLANQTRHRRALIPRHPHSHFPPPRFTGHCAPCPVLPSRTTSPRASSSSRLSINHPSLSHSLGGRRRGQQSWQEQPRLVNRLASQLEQFISRYISIMAGKEANEAKGSNAGSNPSKGKKKEVRKETGLGLTHKKDENFGEWYSEVVVNGEMIQYYDISGCYILRPWAMAIWEKMHDFFDAEIKKMKIRNCYFPLFVSPGVLEKEKDHIEGFAPEVAWVTKSGQTDLEVPIAIRPTSETVMYPYYAKWIRGHRDLPLKLNQWCNVVRWEFSNPTPFIRSREFLWQEGHTAFATKEEADKEVLEILELYRRIYEEFLAVPVIKGKKSELEKFAGGLYTTTVEAFIPNTGRGVQGATSHCLGQNFAKMFEINFENEKGEKSMVWQNSWAYTTRTIGVMIMVHGDDKGLVLPPKVAAVQAIVIPVPFKDADTKRIFDACAAVVNSLNESGICAEADFRDNYSPGWKYSHWEMKGVPLRIEIGPKDLANKQVRLVRRDNSAKTDIPMDDLVEKVSGMLDDIQKNLFDVAKQKKDACIQVVKTWEEFMDALNQKKLILAPWCDEEEVEKQVKERTKGEMGAVKTLCSPFEQPEMPEGTLCFASGKPAKKWTYWGRSY